MHWGFTWSRLFQRAGVLMQNTIVTISSRKSSGFAHRLARETSLLMQTMQALTLLNTVALFVPKMGFGILKDQFRFTGSWISGDWMCATMFQTLQRYSHLHFIDHHLNQPNHSVKRSKIIFKKSPSDFP
jgi:hypothetical protein